MRRALLLLLFCAPAAAAPAERAPKAPAPAPLPPPPDPATLPDRAFCGVEEASEVLTPPSCKLPGLPCGPVPAERIGRGGAEPQDDLDGDGRPDITLAGRRDGPRAEAYGVIYLARQRGESDGYVLSDYHGVDSRADPQVAQVALRLPGGPPLLRDGFDLPLSEGSTYSVARLRRWDGQRFRTLLRFCAHRAAPLPGGGAREGHNRVDFVDVDQDGAPEVVLSGLLRPTVFRFAAGGLRLEEDGPLTARYRQESPEARQARALRAEAARLYSQGEWRRAASVLGRARDIAPQDPDLPLELGRVLLRIGDAARAAQILQQAAAQQPERAAPVCALAEAYRKLDEDDEERRALAACLDRGPEPAQRAAVEERLRALGVPPP